MQTNKESKGKEQRLHNEDVIDLTMDKSYTKCDPNVTFQWLLKARSTTKTNHIKVPIRELNAKCLMMRHLHKLLYTHLPKKLLLNIYLPDICQVA